MPAKNNQNQPSPFEIVTPKKASKGGSKGILIAVLIVVFLILSVVAGVLLVRQRQNIQEKAAVTAVQPLPKNFTFPKAGKVRIYYYDYTNTTSPFNPLLFHINKAGQTVSPQLPGGPASAPMEYLDTDLTVTAGEQFTNVQAIFSNVPQPALGWIAPSATKTCGAPGHIADAAPQINYAASFGEPLVSQQCWADYTANPADPSTHDYNDFFVIFSYTPGVPTPAPTVAPTVAPTATPAPTLAPGHTATPAPTLAPGHTATPAPLTGSGACNSSCSSNSSCNSGYICSGGSCRNPLCTSQIDCLCVTSENTPTPTLAATEAPLESTLTEATNEPLATPREIPVTGVDWPSMTGIGLGVFAILLSILIAL